MYDKKMAVKTTTLETSRQLPRPRTRTRWLTHFLLIIVCLIMASPALYALQVATLDIRQALQTPPILFPPGGERESLVEFLRNPVGDLPTNVGVLFGEPDTNLLLQGNEGETAPPQAEGNSRHDFGSLISNTTIVSLVVVIGKTILALLAGLAFVYFRFPGKWVLFFFVLLTLLMPTEIILQPLRQIMQDLGWRQSNPKLALTVPFLASAIGAFLFRQHFSNIPRELAEAAQIDGATSLRFLFSVLIPMSWNVIVAHALIQFIYMWNQYIWPTFILLDVTSPEQMIQVGVRNAAFSGQFTDYGLLMTAGVIASIPPLVLFLLLQKQFMNGFAITRDK
ncbi:MAG: carbohydrate ABC transporter permease [Chloroflexota bacterium]